MLNKLLYICILFYSTSVWCQPKLFKELTKWGIIENDTVVVKPVYDTVFNFDALGKVCLACNKIKTPSANRFIKMVSVSYNCNYLNKQGKRLMVKPEGSDSATGIFSLNKQNIKQYQEGGTYIIAPIKNKRYLVSKDFKQITFKNYSEIYFTDHPDFLIAEIKTEGNLILKGLIDLNEREIVPFLYSNIKINLRDSIIIACSAGIGMNKEDDIYNYQGKKTDSYRRHIDMATKKFIIHKIFEPKEYYIIVNIKTKEEHIVYSEELQLLDGEEILMRNEDHWFTYDMANNKKKPYDTKYKK